MLSDPLAKAATGLAFIVPAIFVLRWLLTRLSGTPEQWAEERIRELQARHARGEIDDEAYQKRLDELRDE